MFRMTSLCLALAIAGTLHTAHGQATATCPASHPYAYHDGDYCCAHDTEKTYAGEAARCDGGSIGYSSTCCKSDANVRCPTMVCANHGDPLTTAGMVCYGRMRLRNNNDHVASNVASRAACIDLCRNHAAFPCKSFDYTDTLQCLLSRSDRFTSGKIYESYADGDYCDFIGYTSIGCWTDTSTRAIPTLEGVDSRLTGNYGTRENAIRLCYEAAKARGYPAFAIQNGGQCFASAEALNTYQKYGEATNCADGKGGPWANDVYQINGYDGQFRLVNTVNDDANAGRVEVFHDGEWGTVCDDFFQQDDADMVCRSMGYIAATRFYGEARSTGTSYATRSGNYGAGSGTILLDDLQCPSGARNIGYCAHRNWGEENCGHHEDAGVVCGVPSDASFRLVGGTDESNGRVEVYHDGQWGTICDDKFQQDDANMVCRAMGYPKAVAFYGEAGSTATHRADESGYGQGVGQIWLDDLTCPGNAQNLAACTFRSSNTWGSNNCRHYEDAGVACASKGPWAI